MEQQNSNKFKFILNKIVSPLKKNISNTSVKILIITGLIILNVSIGMFLEYFVIKKAYGEAYIKVADKELNEFISNYKYILDNYYGDIDKAELIDGAISGMIESLGDDYSTFLSETEKSNYDTYLKGTFTGIGIKLYITADNNPVVYYVFDNSPASKKGIEVGDILTKIDDTDVKNKTTSEINEIIKNKKKEFSITLERKEKAITVSLYKDKIELISVKSKMLDNNIGYIIVDIFASNTYNQFQKQLAELEKNNMRGLIIDLRDNSGGYLTAVEDMLSLFLDSTHVIYQTESKEQTEKFYSKGDISKKYPIILLSNGNSASGSEVMIGALKEEYGAIQIGETTYGKGTVQQMNTLADGEKYKITIKKWLTPRGDWINKKGIIPDIEISLDEDYYSNPSEQNDNQLMKAVEELNK